MSRSKESTPLYAKVQSSIRIAIRGGTLRPGQILPSEKELEAEHGVSRITVRRALEELEREGLVQRGRGRLARVSDTLVSAVRTKIEDDLAAMLEIGRGTEATLLNFKWRLPDQETMQRLETSDNEPVLEVTRLRSVNGHPILHTIALVPAWIGTRLQPETLNHGTMLENLAQSGIVVASASQELRAAPCPDHIASLIDLPKGSPAFIIDRMVRDRDGRPIQHLLATFRWDSFGYRISSSNAGGGRLVEIEGAGRIAVPSD